MLQPAEGVDQPASGDRDRHGVDGKISEGEISFQTASTQSSQVQSAVDAHHTVRPELG